jgi:Pyruvate/2-oxoacid:ferredoxin oxidoreductase gamma subunit
MVTKEALIAAIAENVSGRFRDLNVKALELGYRLGQEVPPRPCSGTASKVS